MMEEQQVCTESGEREKKIYKTTLFGSIGNFLLLLFKFVAGILGNSAAMVADAVHSLSDFITDIIVVVFVKISSKPCDEDHRYGHGKYETLATMIVSIMLFIVGLGIMYNGVSTIWDYINGKELEEPGMIALVAAILSILIKEFLFHYTARVAKSVNSNSLKANAWHHRSDAFSSIGTAAGIAGAVFFGVQGRVLDPLAAVIVSVFIIHVSYSLIVPCLQEFLEKSLSSEVEEKILDVIKSHSEIHKPHNLRTRRIGKYSAVDVHVRMDKNMTVMESHEVTKRVESDLKSLLGQDSFINIHVEPLY